MSCIRATYIFFRERGESFSFWEEEGRKPRIPALQLRLPRTHERMAWPGFVCPHDRSSGGQKRALSEILRAFFARCARPLGAHFGTLNAASRRPEARQRANDARDLLHMCVTTYLLAQIAAWRWKMFKFVCPRPVSFIYLIIH